MKFFLLLCFLVGAMACSSTSVESEGGKHRIQCLNVVGRCHEKANTICPDGYLVTNRVRPQRLEDDTRYTLNIKCRQSTMY